MRRLIVVTVFLASFFVATAQINHLANDVGSDPMTSPHILLAHDVGGDPMTVKSTIKG